MISLDSLNDLTLSDMVQLMAAARDEGTLERFEVLLGLSAIAAGGITGKLDLPTRQRYIRGAMAEFMRTDSNDEKGVLWDLVNRLIATAGPFDRPVLAAPTGSGRVDAPAGAENGPEDAQRPVLFVNPHIKA